MKSMIDNATYVENITEQEVTEKAWTKFGESTVTHDPGRLGFRSCAKILDSTDPFGDGSLTNKYLFFNDTTTDLTGNRDLSLVGDVALIDSIYGKGINCLSPDTSPTSDYSNLDINFFNDNDSFSIHIVFMVNSCSSGLTNSIYSNYNCDIQVYTGLIFYDDLMLRYSYWDRNTSSTAYHNILPHALELNKKYVVTVTTDKQTNTNTLYVNGMLVDKVVHSAIANNLSQTPRIFGWENNCDNNNHISADVVIYELELYNRALTHEDHLKLLTQVLSTEEKVNTIYPVTKEIPSSIYENMLVANTNNSILNMKVDSVERDIFTIVEKQQLTASDAQDSDLYGASVAISSDGLVLAVGSNYEDTAGTDAGKVYTYKRATVNDVWTEVNQLTASDAQDSDLYGVSVAISNDGLVLVVGAYTEDTAGTNAGKVYTYKRATIDDTWTEVNQLTASDAQDNDNFGSSVSMSNNGLVMAVGAYGEDTAVNLAGKVYTYKRATIDDTWVEVNQLTASDAQDSDEFGKSVALSNNGLVLTVGAYYEDTAGTNAGKVYTYKRPTVNDVWTEVNQLTASNAGAGDYFGSSTALSGDGLVLVVGANGEDDASGDAGKVYTYKRATIDDAWVEVNQLTASDAQDSDYFGVSVSINADGAILVVGAKNKDVAGTNTGKVYEYRIGDLVIADITTSNTNNEVIIDAFEDNDLHLLMTLEDTKDRCISIPNNQHLDIVAVNDPYNNIITVNTDIDINTGMNVMADGVNQSLTNVTFKEVDFNTITEISQLYALDTSTNDQYGSAVSITNDGLIMLVGAYGNDSIDNDTGKVYEYQRKSIYDSWVEVNQLTASDATAGDYFGTSVSISNDGLVLIVGASYEDTAGSNAGKVYTYKRATVNDVWTEVNQLTASDAQDNDNFGRRLSLSSDGLVLVVGAYLQDTAATDAGKVYTYKRSTIDDTWTEVNQLTASDAAASDGFGHGLTLANNGLLMIVGAYNEGSGAGKVYEYQRVSINDAWTEIRQMTALNSGGDDRFGIGVAVSENGLVMAVGADYADDNGTNAGKVYVYQRSTITDNWTEELRMTAADGQASDYYGQGVAVGLDGKILIVGSMGADTTTTDTGKVYEYRSNGVYDLDLTNHNLTNNPRLLYINGGLEFNLKSITSTEAIGYVDYRNYKGIANKHNYLTTGDTLNIDGKDIVLTNTVSNIGEILFDTITEIRQLTASDAGDGAQYGASVDISDDKLMLFIGATFGVSDGVDTGKVYEYRRSTMDDDWVEISNFCASDSASGDNFGSAVNITNNGLILLVGAANHSGDNGKVYEYQRPDIDSDWTEVNVLNARSTDERFGKSIDSTPDGLTLVVGAKYYDSGIGRVYTYYRQTINDEWTFDETISSTSTNMEYFGDDVAISSNGMALIIGAHYNNSTRGIAYSYVKDDTWTRINTILPSDISSEDRFGMGLDMSSDGLLCAISSLTEDTAASNAGKVYFFKRDRIDSSWNEFMTITASDAQDNDYYGMGVALSSDGLVLVVGAFLQDTAASNAGKAYIYQMDYIEDITVTYDDLGYTPIKAKVPNRQTLIPISNKLYELTNIKHTYGEFIKGGRAVQRTLIMSKKDMVVKEPLSTLLYYQT